MSLDKLNNINYILDEDLPIGHLHRFRNKLDNELHKSRKLFDFRGLSIAVAIILIASFTIFYSFNYRNQQHIKLLLANYSPDIVETEKYYNSVLNNRIETLSHKKKMNSDISFELKELNETLKNISTDMKVNPHDERLIAALFGVYQAQLDALENIIEQIN
jgi:hypothetical protein